MNSACSRLFPGKKCVLSSSSYCSVVVPGWNRFFDSFLSVVIINCWQISQRIAEISKFWWVWAVWHVLGWGGHVVRMRGRGHVAHTCLVRRTGEPECRRWQWPAWLVNIHRGRSRELNCSGPDEELLFASSPEGVLHVSPEGVLHVLLPADSDVLVLRVSGLLLHLPPLHNWNEVGLVQLF